MWQELSAAASLATIPPSSVVLVREETGKIREEEVRVSDAVDGSECTPASTNNGRKVVRLARKAFGTKSADEYWSDEQRRFARKYTFDTYEVSAHDGRIIERNLGLVLQRNTFGFICKRAGSSIATSGHVT